MNIIKDIIKINNKYSVCVKYHKFNIGDYVFVSKYSDASPNDPWYVGFVNEIGTDNKGEFVRCFETGFRVWRNAVKIDNKMGELIIKTLKQWP